MSHSCCRYLLSILLLLSSFVQTKGQTVFLDDFTRANNNVVGNGWSETETVANTAATINANLLRLGSNTAGRDYVYRDVSTAYNTVFNTNTGLLTWAFNMRQSRSDPSGFDAGNYGVVFVIGCDNNNFLTGNGYAVVLGNSGTGDNLRLVRFTNGIDANSNFTNIIAPAVDYGSDYLTVKVVYNPVGNAWSLYVGSNLGFFDDPLTATYGQLGVTTADAVYTGTDLLWLGCGWNHATSASDFGYFDNIRIPNLCNVAPEPTTPSSAVTATSIGANSATLNWTHGNGTSCIVIGRLGGAVTSTPADGATYVANASFGLGTLLAPNEYVVYVGSGNSVVVSGLLPITNYEFRVFEYNGSGCITNYLVSNPGIVSFTTILCIPDVEPTVPASAPVIVSGLSSSIQVAWTRGNGAYCIVICRAGAAVSAPPVDGIAYIANAVFGTSSTTAPGEFVVYSGTGNTVTVTGLLANTTYHFAVYEMNSTGCNTNYLTANPALISGTTSAVSNYNLYFGNLHSHSDYSDGDLDNVCNGANSAYCCYDIGNTALNFDFMGISDHNHNEGPVMTPGKYSSGLNEAITYNAAHNDFVALFGMEWGTISTGGHVGVYGINQLVGWNTGNYNIYCAKGDYNTLFNLVANTPNAFATLCHPNNSDFGNIANTPYNVIYDNAIVGVAVKNGPYNSTNISYTDPAAGNNANYYNNLLSDGYHLGPTVDLDNHNSATMGKCSQGRTVVLATSLSQASITDAMLNMRFYATEDYNLNVAFTVNTTYPMGSIVTQSTNPVFDVVSSDPDGEAITQIRILYGVPGSSVAPTVLTSAANVTSLNFTHTFATGTFYYYAELTQADGNITWTSPIWYTKITSPLPIELLTFTGRNTNKGNLLEWVTATELDNDYFTLERSRDGIHFEPIAVIDGAGTSMSPSYYEFTDKFAKTGYNYYRLKQTDFDGHFTYSKIILIRTEEKTAPFGIYPNPNRGNFIVRFDEQGSFRIVLMDATGRIVHSEYAEGVSDYEITLPGIASGFYTIRILNDETSWSAKIMIQHD